MSSVAETCTATIPNYDSSNKDDGSRNTKNNNNTKKNDNDEDNNKIINNHKPSMAAAANRRACRNRLYETHGLTCCRDGFFVFTVLGEWDVSGEGHPVYLCQLGSLWKESTADVW